MFCRVALRAWTNDKCLATKRYQSLFGDQTFYRLETLFGTVWLGLYVFDRVWSCLITFEGHQTFKQQLKTFLLYSCLMGDVLFVWTAAYQTCLKRACVPRLLRGLYQLFDQTCFNRLVTHFNISMFGHQTMFDGVWIGRQAFIVCSDPKNTNGWTEN